MPKIKLEATVECGASDCERTAKCHVRLVADIDRVPSKVEIEVEAEGLPDGWSDDGWGKIRCPDHQPLRSPR